MNLLKQSTAATIKLGPFIDDTDGKTAETTLTISQADIRLSKNGGTLTQSNNTAGATHDALGYYSVPLDSTDTNTLGRLLVAVSESGALPVWQEFLVVKANVYDTLCGTENFDVNVKEVSDDSTAADNLESMFDGTGYAGGTTKLDVNAATITDGAIKASTVATGTLDADAIATDAVTKIQNGLATPTNITGGTITTVTNLTNMPTMPADWVTANGVKADAVTKLQTGLATAAALTTVDTVVDAIKAKTDNLPTNTTTVLSTIQADLDNPAQYKADVSGLMTAAAYTAPDNASITAIKNKTDQLTFTTANKVDASAAVDTTGLATSAALAVVDGNVDAIKAKTDNLPLSPAASGEYTAAIAAIPTAPLLAANYTAPDNAGIAAIKAKTDNLPASPAPANEYDTELTSIQADLDNPNQYKADVSALAQTSHLQDVENKLDLLDTDSVMSFTIDGFTLEQVVQIMAASIAGKLTRTGNTLTFRDLADTLDRIIAETDANKQRINMTYGV